ncbi:HAD family hydrolase [Streptomyces polyrhachis]|uniref:HAD family hydrolase n=1 Tax=Streptomyces polyrhachis TaxID=1282885 RepID=A0ABW2GG64_9ACTN
MPPAPRPFPYRLIATDLDGTLLREDGTVSARTRAALAAAVSRGAVHLVVTGRGAPGTRGVLEALGYRGLAVCGQGAQLYHAGEDRILTSVTLDRRSALAAVEKAEAELGPLALAASVDGLDGGFLAGPGFVAQGSPLVLEHASREELFARPLTKLHVQHPTLGDDELTAAVRAQVGALVDVVLAGPGMVELLPPGLTKAVGLSLAARRLGVARGDAIAFGDMPNDVPMLRWAAHGVAMGNAHPELAAVADEATASNEADGIALVLERLLAG